MNGIAKQTKQVVTQHSEFARNSRASFMGSKIIQTLGIDSDRLDAVHEEMWLRLIGHKTGTAQDECEQLASQIVAVVRLADDSATNGGSKAAIAAVMRESGQSIDPLIAQKFLWLASSPIFWMALDSAGEARTF